MLFTALTAAVLWAAPPVMDRLDFKAALGPAAYSRASDKLLFASKIELMLRSKGVAEDEIVVAVLANAWHESGFDPRLVYPDRNGAKSVGILQLNDKGMGYGMSVADRQDVGNTMRRMFRADYFWSWVAACRDGTHRSAYDKSFAFAAKVLRCAKEHRAARGRTAQRWIDSLAVRRV